MTTLFEVMLSRREYECGEALTGVVRFVEPGHQTLTRARAVRLRLSAKVHGSGNRESHDLPPVTLHEGPVTMSQLSFSVPLPAEGPISWQGRHVKVDWAAVVELDVPWALDPSQAAPFTLKPRGAR